MSGPSRGRPALGLGNRLAPWSSSRTTSSAQRSPTMSSARAMPHESPYVRFASAMRLVFPTNWYCTPTTRRQRPREDTMDVVSETEWTGALQELRAEEKQATQAAAALAAKRRRRPGVACDTPSRLQGPSGEVGLRDMFEGRRQLILYHFMFAPSVEGWPDAGCPGCSMFADQIGHPAHFHARDTTLAFVSVAPIDQIESYRRRMGWTIPW